MKTQPNILEGARVSTSTRWALGTSGRRARCQQRQDEGEGSGMSFPFSGGFGKKLLDFVAIPGVLRVSGVGI